jgi:hypothetical protein
MQVPARLVVATAASAHCYRLELSSRLRSVTQVRRVTARGGCGAAAEVKQITLPATVCMGLRNVQLGQDVLRFGATLTAGALKTRWVSLISVDHGCQGRPVCRVTAVAVLLKGRALWPDSVRWCTPSSSRSSISSSQQRVALLADGFAASTQRGAAQGQNYQRRS